MRHRIRQLWLTLALVSVPGVATAQRTPGAAGVFYLPWVAGSDYRPTVSLVHADTSRSDPATSLERLFGSHDGFGTPDHRHTATFEVGGIEILAEAMRERARIPTADAGRGTRVLDRLSAVGIRAGWPIGRDDTMSLGVAADANKRAEPAILGGRKSIDGDAVVADCTWVHGDHLRMSIDWRADRSSSVGGVNRVVELAQGAQLRERGFRLTLSYLLAGAASSRRTTLGVATRNARIAADDLVAIGSSNLRDIQTSLFLRTTL